MCWFVDDLEKTEMYALTYEEALDIARKSRWTTTKSWKREGYSTTKPSEKPCEMLKPYRMHRGDWKKKILKSVSP